MEVDRVLSSLYGWTRDEIADAPARLLTIHNLIVEDEKRLLSALRAVRQGADLSDELIVQVAANRGCRDLASFDKGMAKRHKGFVSKPK